MFSKIYYLPRYIILLVYFKLCIHFGNSRIETMSYNRLKIVREISVIAKGFHKLKYSYWFGSYDVEFCFHRRSIDHVCATKSNAL